MIAPSLTIESLCADTARPSQTMPLSMVAPGETVVLVAIHGGRCLRKRLADLGLNIGSSVRVVQNAHRGPMILAVKEDCRLALGRGMAHKIQVAR